MANRRHDRLLGLACAALLAEAADALAADDPDGCERLARAAWAVVGDDQFTDLEAPLQGRCGRVKRKEADDA